MRSYITKSIEKFKQDALSKAFYDILKWLLFTFIIFAISKLTPSSTKFNAIISHKYFISLYMIILTFLAGIILTIIVLGAIFRKKYRALQKDNYTDELTGLKNYKALKTYLTNKISEFNQNEKAVSLILLDIDNFKTFNTNQGTNTADKILNKVGELLNNDKRATDEAFRQFLRGDEFLIIANETNLNNAFQAAERKRKLIETTSFIVDGKSYKLTISCGVTELKKEEDYNAVTDRVNAALVEAKSEPQKNNTKTII